MNYYEIQQTITMSLLTKIDDDSSTGKSIYDKSSTVRFKYSLELFSEDIREEFFNKLLKQLYYDLLDNDNDFKSTSLGLWVEIENKNFENAIDLKVLNDMKQYGEKDVEPIIEFYKMTIYG